MKKNHTEIITILILFFAITLISSCKEDKAKTAGDVDGPILTVYKPDAADIYATGDTIYLSAHVEDISQMQDFTVNLIYSDTLLLWPEVPGILGNLTEYELNDWSINTLGVNENAIIRFEASDKHSNVTIVDVPVQLTN
ncbi:MAG: hypothetical protein IPH42_19555 [Bacteroidetes bacterium]|nr:hypothetical protein [Bacteroidota bacterium]